MSYLTPAWINQLIESCWEIKLPIHNKDRGCAEGPVDTQGKSVPKEFGREAILSACKSLNLPSSYRTNSVEVRYPMYLYTPPSPSEIPRLMNSLFRAVNNAGHKKSNLQVNFGIFTAILSIHPIRDGNGRLSREIFKRMSISQGRESKILIKALDEIHRCNGYPFRAALCEIQTPNPDFACHTDFMVESIRRAMEGAISDSTKKDATT